MRTALVLFVHLFCPLFAWSVNPDSTPCVRQMETTFFQANLVTKALALYQIPQGLWVPITQSLQQKNKDIPELMKKASERMKPNPIEYPMNKFETAKILKHVLFNVFLETLRDFQANERPTADDMFDYIYAEQLPNMIHCFGEEVRSLRSNFQ